MFGFSRVVSSPTLLNRFIPRSRDPLGFEVDALVAQRDVFNLIYIFSPLKLPQDPDGGHSGDSHHTKLAKEDIVLV